MPTRSNALSELTRFRLVHRHGLLIRESLPVPVPYGLSDIDLVAMHPAGETLTLPGGKRIGPRLIVESKDEHDWDASGREFGAALASDVLKMGTLPYVPADQKGVKFVMLREQHFRRASQFFGSQEFDRLFIVHALDPHILANLDAQLAKIRVSWLTARQLTLDLLQWYDAHGRPAELRSDLVGDLFHLLAGFCGFRPARPVRP